MLSAMTMAADIPLLPQQWPSSRRRGGTPSLEDLTDPGYDPIAVREDMVFEDRAVGDRYLQGTDPLHRGLQARECSGVLGDNRGDLRREAGGRPRLVGDDESAGFLHRAADRFPVERHQRARIDDLDRDTFRGKRLGRGERLVNEPGEGDDRNLFALA